MSPFLGTTGGGSSLGFRSVAKSDIPGLTQSEPATGAKQIRDAGGTTNGFYWVKPTGYSGSAYQVYCILNGGSGNRHFGGGWTLAMSFKNGTNRPWHQNQIFGSHTAGDYYDYSNWNEFWTGGNVGGSTAGVPYSFQDNGVWSGAQDFGKDGRAIGMWQPMDDLMIMYHDSNQSFNSPGACAYWTRNTSNAKESLKHWWNQGETYWSTGGRQGMYSAGTLSNPQHNPDRQQEWTGDPVYMNNAVGNYTQSLAGYNIIFNVNTSSSTYKCNADHNKSRITNSGMANSVTGNNYPHTMNWGMGQYHYNGGWSGAALHCLGPASYCDIRMSHLPSAGTNDPSKTYTGYSDNNQTGAGSYMFDSGCRNQGGSNMYGNTSHYGWTLWVRG